MNKQQQDKQIIEDARDLLIQEQEERIEELDDIVSVLTIADETGYVDGEGFVVGFNEITDEAKSLLKQRDLEMKARGIEAAIDAGIDLGIIENDADLCEQLRNQAKGGE
jgi:hypothetical protein